MLEIQKSRPLPASSSQAGLLDFIAGPRKLDRNFLFDRYLIHALEFFLDSQAPVYDLAFRMLSTSRSSASAASGLLTIALRIVGCYALMIIVPILQYLWYRYENNRRDRQLAMAGGGTGQIDRMEFSDMTDFERWQTFRYTM